MAEMVEPDRTIMIVSLIGLAVIWGSFFYHRYLQDGGKDAPGADAQDTRADAPAQQEGAAPGEPPAAAAPPSQGSATRGPRKAGKRRR